MNCPICKKELEIKNKKVGETAAGEAIYNEFAICHDCKKQWNLDKQRAKANTANKETMTETPEKPAPVPKKKKRPVPSDAQEQPVRKVKKKRPADPEAAQARTSAKPKEVTAADAPTRVISTEELDARLEEMKLQEERPRKKKRPVPSDAQEQPVRRVKKRPVSDDQPEKTTSDTTVQERPRKKKRRPVEAQANDLSEQTKGFADEEEVSEKRYSNIPPKHVREAREKEMRENYQNMLEEEDEEGGAPIILILIIIILLLAVAAFAGYWFLLR